MSVPHRRSSSWVISVGGGQMPGGRLKLGGTDPRSEPELPGWFGPPGLSSVAASPTSVPVRGGTVERVGHRKWAGGEPEPLPELDLRLHAPIPEVVIVRASGTLNPTPRP